MRSRRLITNRVITTSSSATVEPDHAVGRIVLDAKEVAEGIPAAFTGGTAELKAEEGRFRDLADAVRTAGHFGIVEQQNTDDFAEA